MTAPASRHRLQLRAGPWTAATVLRVLRDHGLQAELEGPEDAVVSGVTTDSRAVQPGDLFMAWTGTRVDAHDFLASAVSAGAGALLVEAHAPARARTDALTPPAGGSLPPRIRVENGRRAAAIVAMAARPAPATPLHVTAVTGTNGKTTTALLLRQLLALRGPAAALGTLGLVGVDGQVEEGTEGLTTPGPVELAGRIAGLEAAGVRFLAMEASSHALDQDRLAGLQVDTAVFTNLGRDHLDYHPSPEAYRTAKLGLLELLRPGGVVVVNRDDPGWAGLEAPRGTREVGFNVLETAGGAEENGDRLRALGVVLGGEGSRFVLARREEARPVALPLPGRFNVENALAAAGAALAAGLELDEVARGLADMVPPPGRLEVIASRPVPVIRDYAHTPDALHRVLETLRPLRRGRLLVVFGAGGERDRDKRPLMGEAVARGADVAIVTSDNPRGEDPDRIVDDILAGLGAGAPSGRGSQDPPIQDHPIQVHRIVDRRQAIRRALELAEPGDAILLAGKGHETVQFTASGPIPFDERQVVQELLGEMAP